MRTGNSGGHPNARPILTRCRIRTATAKVANVVQAPARRPHVFATLSCRSRCVFGLESSDVVELDRHPSGAATEARKPCSRSFRGVYTGTMEVSRGAAWCGRSAKQPVMPVRTGLLAATKVGHAPFACQQLTMLSTHSSAEAANRCNFRCRTVALLSTTMRRVLRPRPNV
jgi:hypothetical protein